MSDSAIEKVETKPLAAPTSPTIEMIIATAVAEKLPVAELRELVALKRDMEADRARQAYSAALVDFQAQRPLIPRGHPSDQFGATRDGRKVPRYYATIEDVAKAVGPTLTECGLACTWADTKQEGGTMIVFCRLTHRDGHFEDTPSPPFPTESNAGASEVQKAASAHTYARRYSMISALGLWDVDKDFDDDGRGDEPPETITDEQVKQIEGLLDGINDAGEYKRIHKSVLDYIERDRLADCPAAQFGRVMNKLERSLQVQEGT
jgi:hypothetical protein